MLSAKEAGLTICVMDHGSSFLISVRSPRMVCAEADIVSSSLVKDDVC